MESSFSSSRKDAFPAGLRVLVVDDDPTWLKILEKMLKKCSYEVTTSGLAREALNLLRERKDGFDIVISDVNMPDMDGFKLLEHVGLEMDLPVIMMSVDGETSRVKKGVQHGACDYLLKPIRMKELRNIWQHVFRKRIHEVRDIESHEGFEGLQATKGGYDLLDTAFFGGEHMSIPKKRKDLEFKHDDKEFADSSSSTKKARVVWSVDLHQKFVKAVNQIGFDKVGPKKILDLMNVPWLTRENVASHLQKYRLYLARLQKENDLKASFCGMQNSDLTTADAAEGINQRHPINMRHQNEVANSHIGFSGVNSLVQNTKSNSIDSNAKGDAFFPMEEPKRKIHSDAPDIFDGEKLGMGLNNVFTAVKPEIRNVAANASIPSQFWRKVPEVNFQGRKDLNHTESTFSPPPVTALLHSSEPDGLPLAPPRLSSIERIQKYPFDYDLLYDKHKSNGYCQKILTGKGIDTLPPQVEGEFLNYQSLEPVSVAAVTTKNQCLNLSSITDVGSNFSLCGDSHCASPDEVLQMGWLQDDFYLTGLGNQSLQFSEFGEPDVIGEVPDHLYDALKFDHEQILDTSELCLLDNSLFIA